MLIRTRAGDSFDTRVAMQSANIDIRSNPAWVPRYPRCDKAGDLFTGRIYLGLQKIWCVRFFFQNTDSVCNRDRGKYDVGKNIF